MKKRLMTARRDHKTAYIAGVLLVGLCFLLGAQEEDDGQITIKTTKWQFTTKPEVKDDATHLVIEARRATSGAKEEKSFSKNLDIKPTPDGSLAMKLRDEKHRISWRPRWRHVGLGGPLLPAMTLSNDQSIFAIVETAGDPKGPNSSRVLFFDTYSWQIIRHINVAERKITKICFVPDTLLLACWAEKQVVLKQPARLMLINCRTGKTVAHYDKLNEGVSAMCVSRDGRLLLTGSSQADSFRVFDARELTLKETIKFAGGVSAIGTNPENGLIAVGGSSDVSVFKRERWQQPATIKLSAESPVKSICFIGAQDFVAVNQAGSALLCRSKNSRSILEKASPLMVYLPEKRQLAVVIKLLSELKILSVPGMSNVGSAYPLKLKPRTRKDPVFMGFLEHYNCYFLLDDGGELYLLFKPRKRWQKHVIFTPVK